MIGFIQPHLRGVKYQASPYFMVTIYTVSVTENLPTVFVDRTIVATTEIQTVELIC